MTIIELSKQILILGPWDGYLDNPKLYKLIEDTFHAFKDRDYYLSHFKELYEKGDVNLVTSRGKAKITIRISPKAIAIPAIVSTAIPRINVLGSLTQTAWIAIILDSYEASGHILEAEYTRQASIPTIFIRRIEKDVKNNPCYVVSLYATRLARQGVLNKVTQEGKELGICKDIILKPEMKNYVKIKGSTGMLRDLTGSIYVTVAFRKDILEDVMQYLRGNKQDIDSVVKSNVVRCLECGLRLLLEQYRDKLEFV